MGILRSLIDMLAGSHWKRDRALAIASSRVDLEVPSNAPRIDAVRCVTVSIL